MNKRLIPAWKKLACCEPDSGGESATLWVRCLEFLSRKAGKPMRNNLTILWYGMVQNYWEWWDKLSVFGTMKDSSEGQCNKASWALSCNPVRGKFGKHLDACTKNMLTVCFESREWMCMHFALIPTSPPSWHWINSVTASQDKHWYIEEKIDLTPDDWQECYFVKHGEVETIMTRLVAKVLFPLIRCHCW